MAINDKDFYASHGLDFDIEKMQIEYTKRVINQAKIEVLTELQVEIEEVARCPYTECIGGDCPFQDCMIHKGRVVSLIQSKINSLKEYT
jgi:hypothetical protein